jgi:hypothetical protein
MYPSAQNYSSSFPHIPFSYSYLSYTLYPCGFLTQTGLFYYSIKSGFGKSATPKKEKRTRIIADSFPCRIVFDVK